ncbi:unnamed protein product [Onchocerca ochengi]|uniref:Uncharacterized protein n=1 Tax=Onchocerca ochengi TaxID=42157 RepID=A0A182EC48_ONCOC|nr:unnamed protein product [Onchocerca ochengi]
MSAGDKEERSKQMENMDMEAIAKTEAATKIIDLKKKKGYDDIVISESRSRSISKQVAIKQETDNDEIRKDEKSQQLAKKMEPVAILEVNKKDQLAAQPNINGQLQRIPPQHIETPPVISPGVAAEQASMSNICSFFAKFIFNIL